MIQSLFTFQFGEFAVKLSYMALILSFSAVACQPALADPDSYESQGGDSGASGVIDGSDVYQFLNSGPVIDTTRMEEASRKFDRMIKLPPRSRPARSWQEQIDRERAIQNDVDPATIDERVRYQQPKGSRNSSGPAAPNAQYAEGDDGPSVGQGYAQTETNLPLHGLQNGQQGQYAPPSGAGGSGKFGPQYGAIQSSNPNAPNYLPIDKKKQPGAFVRAAEWLGFPVSDEFLPGTVDASIAGDLPPGADPRVYVHPESLKQLAARQRFQDAAEDEQPPSIMVDEADEINQRIPSR